jgi:hypothetical protein
MAKHRGSIKPRVGFPACYVLNVKINPSVNSNGTNDPASWNEASCTADPIDALEPIELSESDYRICARRFLACLDGIDRFMSATHSGLPSRKWIAVSLGLGLGSTRGRSETELALELGITRAAVSKSVIQVLELTGLSPAFGLKSEQDRETYRRTNGQRRRLEEHGRLGDIAPSVD